MCSRCVVSILCARYCSLSLVVTKPPGLAVNIINRSSLDLTLLRKLDPRPTHGMQASAEQSRFGGGWPFSKSRRPDQNADKSCVGWYIPIEHLSRLHATSSSQPGILHFPGEAPCSFALFRYMYNCENGRFLFSPSRRHIPINLVTLFRSRQVIHPDLPIRCFRVPSTPNPALGGPTNSLTLSFRPPGLHP